MTKGKPGEGEPTPVLPDGTQLHEHLVRQTLKMNPAMSAGQAAGDFIRAETGKIADAERVAATTDGKPKRSREAKVLNAFVAGERKRHKTQKVEIDRQRKALDKDELTGRQQSVRELVRYLVSNVKTTEDLEAVLADNKAYLEELATSAKEIIHQVSARRRKQRG